MKKILTLLLVTSMATISMDAWYAGGHGGYHGGYHGGGYGRRGYGWGGAGAGIATGALVGTTVGLAASSGSRNSQQSDPVANAQAAQMRYDLQKQQEEDRENASNGYESDNSRSRKIQQLKAQIADLESDSDGEYISLNK